MKTEIYNVEGIEIEVERTSKDDTEAERRKMAYAFIMIREQSGMNRKDFSDWLGIPYNFVYLQLLYLGFIAGLQACYLFQ